MAQIGAERDDGVGGAKTAAEQSEDVEVTEPLTIGHVALAALDVLDVARVDEHDGETADAGGFHRDVGDATREREERAYRAFTVLPLDRADNNARLIAKPESDWLPVASS